MFFVHASAYNRHAQGSYHQIIVKNSGGKTILEDPGVDGRIILKWTCERLDGGAWTGSIWLRIGTGGELL
jgi:hypothetical protein